MNKLKTTFSAVLMAVSLLATAACKNETPVVPDPQEPQKELSALDFALTMGVGWNLGNNLDAHIDGVAQEDGWGNKPATQKTFDAVAKAGFKSVRIPVTWLGHFGKGPTYFIEKEYLDRVAEVVGYAKKAGLKVIINIHHDGFGAETDPSRKGYFWLNLPEAAKDEARNTEIKQQLAMLWMQIATRFQNEGDYLIFETLNEIQDGKWGSGENLTDGGQQYRVLNEWNQICVDVIRGTGGNNLTRFIGIPGYVAQPGLTCDYLRIPDDETPNRLMVAVHMYDPWDYAGAGKYNEWGHTGKDVVPDKAGEAEFNATLDRLYMKFVRRGVPVYLGEYGCVHRGTEHAEAFRKYYLEYTCRSLRRHKMPVLVWDNGHRATGEEAFGLLDHGSGSFIANSKEIVKIMVDAWGSDDPAYTLESIYERAPQAK